MNRRAVSPCRLTPPVQDASAWYGPALLARGNRLERLDAAEIGAVFGMSPSGVRGHLSRLLERLRKELRDG